MNKYAYKLNRAGEGWSAPIYNSADEAFEVARLANETLDKLGAMLEQEASFNDLGDAKTCDCVYIGIAEPFIPEVNLEDILDAVWEQAIDTCGNLGSAWKAKVLEKDKNGDLSEAFSYILNRWMAENGIMPDCKTISLCETRYFDEYVVRCCGNCLYRSLNASGEPTCLNEDAFNYCELVDEDGDCELWEKELD